MGKDSWKFSLQNRVIMAHSGPLECWLEAAATAWLRPSVLIHAFLKTIRHYPDHRVQAII